MTDIVERLRRAGTPCEHGWSGQICNEAADEIEGLRKQVGLCETSSKIEVLAAYAHEAWSGWMKYMVGKIKFGSQRGMHGEGEVQMWLPNGLRYRWERQMNTAYADLPESEKESDRKEAKKIIEVLCR